ncbi:hypothetical protein EXIGLDRAFT_639849, partial [Exidia glandulosa HHB12029]
MEWYSVPRSLMPLTSSGELDACVYKAIQALPGVSKTQFLLNSALALIDAGQYGDDVENYFDVLLRMPGLPQDQLTRALLARGSARRAAGEQLLARAEDDFRTVLQMDPHNAEARRMLRRESRVETAGQPLYRQLPLEVWELIASFTPRHHLRQWLFVSSFFRDVAQRSIFRKVDVYFSEDTDIIARVMDFFERVKADPAFAVRIKTLRLHWAMEDGDLLDLLIRIFRTTLPAFKGLYEFEWIGYPELGPDCVVALQDSHPRLQRLGMVGWHFDAIGVEHFSNLVKFTLRAEDDDGSADMGEIRMVLDNNEQTLRHLCLGASLNRVHSWDEAFESSAIRNLSQLELVDTRISHLVLTRLIHASSLRALTLHGTFEDVNAAAVILGSDHVVDGQHTLLPLLEEFRFVMVGHDDDLHLFQAAARFVKGRRRIRRLDLGNCPFDLLIGILPSLIALRVLRLKTGFLSEQTVASLVKALPREMSGIHVAVTTSARPLHEFAPEFAKFAALEILHLNRISHRRPQPTLMSDKDFHAQTDAWLANARSVAQAVRSLDFVGWHREHFVVARNEYGEVAELKELPTRKRLDCGQGVDLGDDGAWLERKDVPVDWETPGL